MNIFKISSLLRARLDRKADGGFNNIQMRISVEFSILDGER
ncbi:12019_t:CDS:2 [Funneliformis caledonium]|uniref:12019_t:CDS:1 n=1 Tax=Funneliformis caledonium TaxID=1117310 RepID=A0A9N9G5X2_9GLOM|nr:12019_t:CDS:2 [Funneliformis caledonium]